MSKYKNKRTTYNDRKFDSKFEAECAETLDWIVKSEEIKAVEYQYKADMQAYDENGKHALSMSHKIDFRLEHWDKTYTLLEAKGFETTDYRNRVKWLKAFWLPIHLDHAYVVWYYGKPIPKLIKGKVL